MITPRRTRLVRVADLHEFRDVIAGLCAEGAASDRAIVVPTRGAALALTKTLRAGGKIGPPVLLTRDQLYEALQARLPSAARRLTVYEREAILHAAAEDARDKAGDLPFRIRPGLIAEMQRFYDQLRRQSQQVGRFETLITDALGAGDGGDVGAERLRTETRFLADAFRGYERRVQESGACDEHGLRERLVDEPAPRVLRHIVVTVADWIADPAGLFAADFDLLARLPGLQSLDLVCTVPILGSGFHERIHQLWPGLEETEGAAILTPRPRVRPALVRPAPTDVDHEWWTYRDRDEELTAVVNRLRELDTKDQAVLERVAIVFKRPLPYLYIAPDTLGAAHLAYQVFDELPLAAEPFVSSLDLILDAVETRFTRDSLVALLRSPHLRLADDDGAPASPSAIAAMNKDLSQRRYLGGLDHLAAITSESANEKAAAPALRVALKVARDLASFAEAQTASGHLRNLIVFFEKYSRPGLTNREQRVRDVLRQILGGLADAHGSHHDPLWTIDELAISLRRWIGEQTFPVESGGTGIHLLDDQAARYGEFDDITIVGLIEHEWPERTRRNIFYPAGLLKALGWPSERDRRAGADARLLDLLTSSSREVALSTFTLDDEAIVTRSVQLDEVPRAKLSTVTREPASGTLPTDDAPDWAGLRRARTPSAAPAFHGSTGPRPSQSWSVSALETYITCPFKFFAQHVLKLEEEPDDEEVMDPRRQGQFVHGVFETFFAEWQEAGFREITPANLDAARAMFVGVVDRALEPLPESEAGLERTRLLGSSAASGLGEAVLRMEAERSTPVVERLLEHELRGRFTISTDSGPRDVELRGKADRVDLLADGTFRLIDYKLGWPPDRTRALQLPIYSVCAEQRLDGRRGRHWTLGEAVYLAFKGPKRVVPLFTAASGKDEVLAKAQQRLADTIDAIDRGEFPPAPDDVYRCETCAFSSVCRKDYVGDV